MSKLTPELLQQKHDELKAEIAQRKQHLADLLDYYLSSFPLKISDIVIFEDKLAWIASAEYYFPLGEPNRYGIAFEIRKVNHEGERVNKTMNYYVLPQHLTAVEPGADLKQIYQKLQEKRNKKHS